MAEKKFKYVEPENYFPRELLAEIWGIGKKKESTKKSLKKNNDKKSKEAK